MGPTLILRLGICQKPLKSLFHRGSSALFTLKTPLCESLQLPLSARFLCTRDNNPHPGGRQTDRRIGGQTDGQARVRNSTIRYTEEEDWRDEVKGRGKSPTLRQKPSFPRSVFAAGTAKRTAEIMSRKAALVSRDQREKEPTKREEKMQPPDRPLSAAEWRKLKESYGNIPQFDIMMMNVMLNSETELDITKSLLTFVATERGTLSYELLLRYLTLCERYGHDAEMFDVYDIMRGSFPSLDTGACSLFIKLFTRTARWREALTVLQDIKKVITPSPRNYGCIISAAMVNGDLTTAWALYDELIEKGLSPHQETWGSMFKAVGKTKEENGEKTEAISQSEHQERLLGILLYMRNNQIYPKHSLACTISAWFESLTGQNWTGSWTSISPKGTCRCCGAELESTQLTDEEYQQLKDRVFTDIIHGQDVFKKTTPEELQKFMLFMKKKPAFHVVIDGLNVANINSDKRKQSEALLAVVSELNRQGLTVLVLGRKHMLTPSVSWARHHMDLILKKAHCFFTENISEDDPFLLYATLNSGKSCKFVTRDLMRDHKACLTDMSTRRLFFKWQRGHQLVLSGPVNVGKKVRFQHIFSYDTIVQTSGDSWHLPYDDTEDRCTHEVPQQWLCLTKKH
ncbi:mitochondrial ribonuclease P catalytic subunit isoform X2 [Dicentrarchus labrax]|uniref:mitochondrial ribonuclease P catalytic subunit isoform X2 n=1 Tax=Dicentrarchus labrax TaxID=13489 RepID=UPI0021F67C59|nr:mitochondrial ribonuclease P catalytic subunit isoform X2 [Dicentrarchus labrax]